MLLVMAIVGCIIQCMDIGKSLKTSPAVTSIIPLSRVLSIGMELGGSSMRRRRRRLRGRFRRVSGGRRRYGGRRRMRFGRRRRVSALRIGYRF